MEVKRAGQSREEQEREPQRPRARGALGRWGEVPHPAFLSPVLTPPLPGTSSTKPTP